MSAIIIASEAKQKAIRVLTRPDHLSMLYSTWTCLARELDVAEVSIKTLRERIIVGTCYLPDAVSAVIEDWVSRKGSKATLSILVSALEELGLKSIAEALEHEFGIGKTIIEEDSANKILFKNTLPENIPYYIPRTLISRYNLDSKQLFKGAASVWDVFCFSGIQRFKLAYCAKNGITTDNSSSQIQREQLSTKFIVLDSDAHFPTICSKSFAPTHWIDFSKHENNKSVKWVQSTGDMETIQQSVISNYEEQEQLTEEQILQIMKENKNPICFSDCPGMGKSTILINIGHKIKERSPEKIIVYFELRIFINKMKAFKLSNHQEAFESVLFHTLCSTGSSKGAEELKEIFASDTIKIELLLDGFDEIFPGDVTFCLEIIKGINTLKYTRILIASRPHFLEIIENALNVLGYNILSFTDKNQEDFLSSYWLSQNPSLSQIKLTGLAEKTLEIISSQTRDQKFAGIPLRCFLIAQVFEETAKNFCTVESEHQELPALLTITSTSDLFTRMIEMKLQKYYSTYGITKYRQGALTRMLMKLAMDLIFPGELGNLNSELESVDVSVSDLINTGLILRQGAVDLNEAKFVHQTIAEYFCAKFAANLVEQNGKGGKWTLDQNIFFFKKVLKLDFNALYGSFGEATQISKREFDKTKKCAEIFCKETGLIDSDSDSTYLEFQNVLIPFAHPVICYFLNSLLHIDDQTSTPSFYIFKSIILGCVRNNFFNIFKVLTNKRSSQMGSKIFNHYLLFVLLHFGQIDFVQEGFSYFEKYHKHNLELKRYILSHIGAIGNYTVFEYFCEEKKLREILFHEKAKNILVSILSSSIDDTEDVVGQKLQIVRYILAVNNSLVKTLDVKNTEDCHAELLCCLIELGLDVEAQDESGNTCLHCRNNYHQTITQIFKIICLIPPYITTRLFQIRNKKGETILFKILANCDVSISILEQFKAANADFNSCDKYGNSLLMIAIEQGRSVEIVKYLLKQGAYPNHFNQHGVSVLFCWKYRITMDTPILEELIRAGCDVFRLETGRTFLHYLLTYQYRQDPLSPDDFHDIVRILIANGKEKLLETKSELMPQLTPLQLALRNIKMHKETVTLLKSVETLNFEKLWEEKESDG